MSTQTDTDDDSTGAEIEILYVRGAHSRDAEIIDEDDDHFQLTRDLRAFGPDAFDEWGHDLEDALENAYVSLGESVEIPMADFDSVEDLLGFVYETCQGHTRSASLPYNGEQHRSMSPGDIIVVDGAFHMVDRWGFEELDVDMEEE